MKIKRFNNIIRKFIINTAGTAAVEFALLVPLYFFLLFGMTAYGIYFCAAHSVQQLSADAARTSIAGLNAQERQRLARNFIETNASGYMFIDPNKLTVNAQDSTIDASQFNVVISYDASELPIWALWKTLPMPGRIIARSATIRLGGI